MDADRRELRVGGADRPIEPQVFDVLLHLIEHRDRVVTKEELLDEIWGDRFVSESALTSRIKSARQAVGDSGRAQGVIRTVHGRGYRFVAPIDTDEAPTPTSPMARAATAMADRKRVEEDRDWQVVGREAELAEIERSAESGPARCALLTGEAGIGKSQLARVALDRAVARGWTTIRAHGHAEAKAVPLACLAHLLPAEVIDIADLDGDMARSVLVLRVREILLGRADGTPLLLVVDDVDQLDSLSLTIVGSLVEDERVFVLLTQRADSTTTLAFDPLVRSGAIHRIHLQPLPADVLEQTVMRALDGPIAPHAAAALVAAAGGNPGMLRQLVEASLSAGSLRRDGAVWTLVGPVATSADMATLVDERLEGLDGQHRRALEMLALSGQLDLDMAIELGGEEVIDGLELQGMVALDTRAGRETLRLTHPLFGEVLRSELTPLRARRLKTQLAAAFETCDSLDPSERLRLVRWRIDVGGDVDPDLMLDVAALALLDRDVPTATALIERLEAEAPSARVAQLAAELLFIGGRFREAGDLLSSIDLDELEPLAAAFAVRRIATSLFYGHWDQQAALEHLATSFDCFEGEARATLEGYWVMLAAVDGRQPAEALERGLRLLDDATDFVRLELLCGVGMAAFVLGQLQLAAQVIAEFDTLVSRLPPSLTWAGPDYAQFVAIHTRTELGDLSGALARLDAGVAILGRATLGFLPIAGARCLLRVGRPVEAIEWLDPLIELTELIDLQTNARPMQSTTARAALALGDHDRARAETDLLDATISGTNTFVELDLIETICRVRAELGDAATARTRMLEAATAARDVGNTIMEASLLGARVEIGGGVEAADRLGELTAVIDGELIELKARHARAVRDGDGQALAAVADRYAELGFVPLAAAARP